MTRPVACPRCKGSLVAVKTFRDPDLVRAGTSLAQYWVDCAECGTSTVEDDGPLMTSRREVI